MGGRAPITVPQYPRRASIAVGVAALCLPLGLLAYCGRQVTDHRPPVSEVNAPAGSVAATLEPARPPAGAPEPAPETLFTAGVSAYSATLALDENAVYALTSTAAFRAVPGQAAERRDAALGFTTTLDGERICFWSEGALRELPLAGGEPRILARIAQPQYLAASAGRLAWLTRSDAGRFTISTLDGSVPRLVYAPPDQVVAFTLQQDQVFFVERGEAGKWRIGRVSLVGGSPRYTPEHPGRTPSMLAAAGDVFYYDGPSSTVRRLPPNLDRENIVARDVICSPIAVAQHIYCAQPGGLLEVSFEGVVLRTLPRRGTIASVAATPARLAWLVDIGTPRDGAEPHLAVETLSLAPTGRP